MIYRITRTSKAYLIPRKDIITYYKVAEQVEKYTCSPDVLALKASSINIGCEIAAPVNNATIITKASILNTYMHVM